MRKLLVVFFLCGAVSIAFAQKTKGNAPRNLRLIKSIRSGSPKSFSQYTPSNQG